MEEDLWNTSKREASPPVPRLPTLRTSPRSTTASAVTARYGRRARTTPFGLSGSLGWTLRWRHNQRPTGLPDRTLIGDTFVSTVRLRHRP